MRVRIQLSAITRLEYSEVIEVPDDTPPHELDELVRECWDRSDGGDFTEDTECFEKGDCWWEKMDPADDTTMSVEYTDE